MVLFDNNYDSYFGPDNAYPDEIDDIPLEAFILRLNSNGTKMEHHSFNYNLVKEKYDIIVEHAVQADPNDYEIFTIEIYDFNKDTIVNSFDIHESRI